MKRIIFKMFIFVLLFSLTACGNSNKHEGEAKTPSASGAQQGRMYQEVITDFESKGFTNIKTEKLEDLINGWTTKDGEVESVSVDGDEEYSADVWYSNNVEVMITYHTFPEDGDNETVNDNGDIIHIDPNDPRYSTILTVEDNDDLAAVLSTKNELDSTIKDFAEDYSLYTIEFDGYIAEVANYEDSKTRLNVLVYAGNYSTEDSCGPNIQLENISTADYNWTKDSVNKNIHIVAKVMEYREASGLLILSPDSVELR